MLKACPEIHRYGPYLHLDTHVHCLVREKHRDLDYHMIAAISVFLWILYIILDGQNLYVILSRQHACDLVYIVNERTYDPDACNIVEISDHVSDRYIKTAPLHFFNNADRILDSRLYSLYRVALVPHRHVVVEHLQLGLYLKHGALIPHHHVPEQLYLIKIFFGVFRECV